ncbi:DUF1150 family protein [Acuticoccus sp.]|uniref:BQ00720 family protein n=1 Tax=Acuticoccus sp. TaxID=1904378 RepID=UPI003B52C8DA
MNETINGTSPDTISPQMLADLGSGYVAYVRTFLSEEVNALFPQAPAMAPGQKLWALLSANGTPILLADTPQAVLANAAEHNLLTVSVH